MPLGHVLWFGAKAVQLACSETAQPWEPERSEWGLRRCSSRAASPPTNPKTPTDHGSSYSGFKHRRSSKQATVFVSPIYAHRIGQAGENELFCSFCSKELAGQVQNLELGGVWLCLMTLWGWFSLSVSASSAFLPLYIDCPPNYGLVAHLHAQVSPQCSPLLVLRAAVSPHNPSVLQTCTEKGVSRK